jgi:hypothetical protein
MITGCLSFILSEQRLISDGSVFPEKRKELDYKRFSQVSQEQSKVIELINGMQEIKMHNAEKQKDGTGNFFRLNYSS